MIDNRSLSSSSFSLIQCCAVLSIKTCSEWETRHLPYCLLPNSLDIRDSYSFPCSKSSLKNIWTVLCNVPGSLCLAFHPHDTFVLNKTNVFMSSWDIMFFQLWSFLLFSQVSSHWASSVVLKTQGCTAAETFLCWLEWKNGSMCPGADIPVYAFPYTGLFYTSLTLLSRSACWSHLAHSLLLKNLPSCLFI